MRNDTAYDYLTVAKWPRPSYHWGANRIQRLKITNKFTTKKNWTQLNRSSSPEDKAKEDHEFDCFIKPEEPTEDETVLHAGLFITGTVCHSQSQKLIRRIHFALYSILAPIWSF